MRRQDKSRQRKARQIKTRPAHSPFAKCAFPYVDGEEDIRAVRQRQDRDKTRDKAEKRLGREKHKREIRQRHKARQNGQDNMDKIRQKHRKDKRQ